MLGTVRARLAALRDNSGSVLPIAAVSAIVLASMVGGGIDLSRTYRVKTRLQAACDAGTLAGRRAIANNGYDTAAQTQATNYFNINFDPSQQDAQNTAFATSTPDSGSTVNGTASARVNTLIMKLFGISQMPVAVTCSASMQVGNSDVVMVLDTTGSMRDGPDDSSNPPAGGSKIAILRVAMKSFYDTLAAATSASNARIRYGFVPYSTSVNVGRLLYNLNPSYLVDSWAIQSREPVFTTGSTTVQTGWNDADLTSNDNTVTKSSGSWSDYGTTIYSNSTNCNIALPSPNPAAWANNGAATVDVGTPYVDASGNQIQITTTTQPQTRYEYRCKQINSNQSPRKLQRRSNYQDLVTTETSTQTPVTESQSTNVFSSWNYHQVTYDVSQYKAFQPVVTQTGNNGTNQTSTWAGCIEERQSVATGSISYSSVSGMSPSGARDLDIDSAPTGDNATKWAPYWKEIAYYRRTTNSGGGTSDADIASSTIGAQVSQSLSACPSQSRLLATMTESAFDAYADALTTDGYTYHDIGMLWGARLSSPTGIFSANVTAAPSNGGAVARHIIYMTDGLLNPNNKILSSYGLEFHDHRVSSNGSTDLYARHRLRFLALCEAAKAKGIRLWVISFGLTITNDLRTCGSPDSSYQALNASELNASFQDIANQVGELRIIQ